MKRCAFITLGDDVPPAHVCSNRRPSFGYLRQAWADIRAQLQLEQESQRAVWTTSLIA
jgi:hypothetical protein